MTCAWYKYDKIRLINKTRDTYVKHTIEMALYCDINLQL